MKKDFVDLNDAGIQLAHIVDHAPDAVIAIVGQGAEIAIAIANRHDVKVVPVIINRDSDNSILSLECNEDVTGLDLVVVDDAIETGHTLRATVDELIRKGVGSISVAVPICPRDVQAEFQGLAIIAVVRPMVRRSLAWHYEHVPATSQSEALELIAAHNQRF